MSTTTNVPDSSLQALEKIFAFLMRFVLLVVLYFALFAIGGQFVAPFIPNSPAEPGPLPQMMGLLIVCATSVLVIMLMIASSRWHGWKLMLSMSVAFYLVMTLVTQLESWYFLYGITIGKELMLALFIQGLPLAFLFVPIAVLVMGRFRRDTGETGEPRVIPMPITEWLWKLGVIYLAYLAMYYLAGYFIAWQNPELRAFYGSPGEALPFFQHMANVFLNDPWLTPYQLLRTLIWVAGAYLVIRGSRLPLWQTAIVVGLVLSVPQNIGHLLPNPLIPLNSVRLSHLVETASSTFIFGLIVTWLLYPKRIR